MAITYIRMATHAPTCWLPPPNGSTAAPATCPCTSLAKSVEATARLLLAEYQPDRKLQTNVEYYTALLLHGRGLPSELFSPTFAVSRTAGWIAHSLEQRQQSRIIRPQSEFVGPRDRQWLPIEHR